MIKEIQRRPMARPLLIWITGILLQTSYPVDKYIGYILVIPVLTLSLSYCFNFSSSKISFSSRWLWGMQHLLLLLFLSIQITTFHQTGIVRNMYASSLQEKALTIRSRMVDKIASLDLKESEKAVLATVVLGDRSNLSFQTRKQFVMTGAAHILAVSGMHVAIVCGFFTFLLSLLPYRHRFPVLIYIVQLLIVWGYVLLTGGAASAVRAGCMLSFYLTGKVLIKNTDSYNTLAASAFCMLVYNPFYLFDIGFQLSYIAVFFILYLEPLFRHPFQLKNPLLVTPFSWLTVALAAQVGVTLLCIYYFKTVTLLFLFTALPLMLFIILLLPVAMLFILFPGGLFPGYPAIAWVVQQLTHYFCYTVEMLSSIKGLDYSISLKGYQVLLGYILLITSTEWIRYRKKSYL